MDVLYLCDRKLCETCDPNCSHTRNLLHAESFYEYEDGKFAERKIETAHSYIQKAELPLNGRILALNIHEEYVAKFAKNHGLTAEDARKQPMVMAHKEFIDAITMGNNSEPTMDFLSKVPPDVFIDDFLTDYIGQTLRGC